MEYEHGNGSSKDLTEIEVTNDKTVDCKHGNGSGKDLTEFEVTNDKTNDLGQSENPRSPSSSESLHEAKEVAAGDSVTEPEVEHLPLEVSVRSPSLNMEGGSESPILQSPSYDPNRIPTSIFCSKPSTPLEWSVASSESLFSIQVGNFSFSRDHVFMFYKSGDYSHLAKFDDLNNVSATLSPVAAEAETSNRLSVNTEKIPEQTEVEDETAKTVPDETADPITDVSAESAEDQIQGKKQSKKEIATFQATITLRVETLNSNGINSDDSIGSRGSFAFPVLAGDNGRYNAVKADIEKHQRKRPSKQKSQPHTPNKTTPITTPKAPKSSWLSCFCCCSLC